MRGRRTKGWYAAVATIVFVAADQIHLVTRWLGRIVPPPLELGLRDMLQVVLCTLGIAVAHGPGHRSPARELGLRAPVGRALVFALLASLPMLLTFALTSSVSRHLTFAGVAVGCVIAPFAEEILFRAYLFRQLYRRARAGFWISALIPSVLFALGHLYQSDDPAEIAGILAITGLGSILGCWVFVRWQDNLWAVFGLHALMNLWWELFAIDETALGGRVANLARLATIALAVVLSIGKDRLWPRLPSETAHVASGSPSGPDDGHHRLAMLPARQKVIDESDGGGGFGSKDTSALWITEGRPPEPGLHLAFGAADRDAVDAFHEAALQAGGRDNGRPGIRENYGPTYYAAFVLDPDGNNIEAVCQTTGRPKGR